MGVEYHADALNPDSSLASMVRLFEACNDPDQQEKVITAILEHYKTVIDYSRHAADLLTVTPEPDPTDSPHPDAPVKKPDGDWQEDDYGENVS